MNYQDYFTVGEYREITKDTSVPYRADDDDIIRVQGSVVERLEQWARSAWPNVTIQGTVDLSGIDITNGTAAFVAGDVGSLIRIVGAGTAGVDLVSTIATVTDADTATVSNAAPTAVVGADVYIDRTGTAATPRSITHKQMWRVPLYTLSRKPVIELTSFTLADVDVEDYTLLEDEATLRWMDWDGKPPEFDGPRLLEVSYSFGFTSTPEPVKRPCIRATEALLLTEEQRGGIPRNVDRYSTEATTFDFNRPNRRTLPWPWDEDSSEDVRAYWDRDRPMHAIVV